ncbi:mCG128706, partial [Mus musculus]
QDSPEEPRRHHLHLQESSTECCSGLHGARRLQHPTSNPQHAGVRQAHCVSSGIKAFLFWE